MCCVVFIVSGCRKEKNERHFAWLLIAVLVCRNLILYVCVVVSLWSLCGISLFYFSQDGGAIYKSDWWCLDIRGLGHVHVVLSGGIGFFFFL